jgi:hypothetical protein
VVHPGPLDPLEGGLSDLLPEHVEDQRAAEVDLRAEEVVDVAAERARYRAEVAPEGVTLRICVSYELLEGLEPGVVGQEAVLLGVGVLVPGRVANSWDSRAASLAKPLAQHPDRLLRDVAHPLDLLAQLLKLVETRYRGFAAPGPQKFFDRAIVLGVEFTDGLRADQRLPLARLHQMWQRDLLDLVRHYHRWFSAEVRYPRSRVAVRVRS